MARADACLGRQLTDESAGSGAARTGQGSPADSSKIEQSPATETGKVSKPKPGPKYLDLRYDEDFSYLEGEPGSYREDFFDAIKNISLGGDWRLSLGGELRLQLESETNRTFGAAETSHDAFYHHRFLFHGDLRFRKLFRVFVQGIEAFDEHRDLAPRPTDENQWDLHQLFFDLRFLGEGAPWTLRVGRQELNYGAQRLLSPLDWSTVRRRFDGTKVFARTVRWDFDFFYVKPTPVQRKQRDRYDEDFDLYGIYATYKGIPRHGVDAYVFAVDDAGDRVNPNGRRGDRSIFTLGTRFWGQTGGFDYESELAGQWGRWAGDTVEAWSVSLNGGHTFALPTKPRLGAGFDWASGDRNPTDRRVQTFDQLFPLGHGFFGYLDLLGRQNITGPNVSLTAWPAKDRLRASVAWHHFWLAHSKDALYNAAGSAMRRDPTGRSGREVGTELDATLLWKIDVHSTLLLGWSHFWASDFIEETGRDEDADLFYVQYAFKF